MPTTFDTHDLLKYNAKHSVLICRECEYAIQKSALGSHLLRHKIYRGERQRLLSSISQLQLLEPDNVQLPPAGSPPVDGLPLISGYRCTAIGCESLCASFKRMRRHWSESHGVTDPPDSFAHSVNIQTFFRGTKLRYFEVSMPESTNGKSVAAIDGELAPHQHGLDLGPTPAPAAPKSTLRPGHPCDLDMEALRYFHHFITTTSLTLPVERRERTDYWRVDVVAQALRRRWLMCGLLAISASHLAVVSDDKSIEIKQLHAEKSAQFLQEFLMGWGEVRADPDVLDIEEAKAGAQMACIQRCCHWTSELPALNQGKVSELVPFQLRSFTAAIQGSVDPNYALRSAVESDDIHEEASHRAGPNIERNLDSGLPGNVPPAILERLRTLPYRMAEALEKPDSALDFIATVAALDTLIDCFALSYASENMEAVWEGMELWLSRISDHFRRMVWGRSPAALVVLAHWTCLVDRAEGHCWFMRGLAVKALRQIVREIPEDSGIQSLVENLID